VFWIEGLIPGEGRQAFVNREHNQELGWCYGGDDWGPSVGVGTLAHGGWFDSTAPDAGRACRNRILHSPPALSGAALAGHDQRRAAIEASGL
jgi:hypothetical protein